MIGDETHLETTLLDGRFGVGHALEGDVGEVAVDDVAPAAHATHRRRHHHRVRALENVATRQTTVPQSEPTRLSLFFFRLSLAHT